MGIMMFFLWIKAYWLDILAALALVILMIWLDVQLRGYYAKKFEDINRGDFT